MANDVKFEITADAAKANAELEKLRSQVSKLTGAVEKSKEKSKDAGDAGSKAFKGMGESVNSTVQTLARSLAVMQTIKASFQAVMGYYADIRKEEDRATVSIDKSVSAILKEGGFAGRNDRSMITGKVFDEAKRTGLTSSEVAGAMQNAVNNGASVEDLMSGKNSSTLDIMRATNFKDSNSIEDMLQSQLIRSNLKDTKENRDMLAAKNVYAFGQDIGEAQSFIGKLPKNVRVEEGMAAFNLAKDYYGGSTGKAGSELQGIENQDDYNKFLKKIGASKKDIERGVRGINEGSSGKMRDILSIADNEQEAKINRSRAELEYFNYSPNKKTQEQIKNERTLKNLKNADDLKNIIADSSVKNLDLSEERASELSTIANAPKNLSVGLTAIMYRFFSSQENKNQIEAGSKQIKTNDSKAGK